VEFKIGKFFSGSGKRSCSFLHKTKISWMPYPTAQRASFGSHVSQSMPISRRVEIWLNAVHQFLARTWTEKFFELYDDGVIHPVKVVKR
jgi:hypothetical protein